MKYQLGKFTLGPTFLLAAFKAHKVIIFMRLDEAKASSLRIRYTLDKYSEHQTLNYKWQAP